MSKKKIEVKDYDRSEAYTEEHPGKVTATILDPVELPVSWLKTLPGLRAEHTQLNKSMSKIQKLSKLVCDKSFRDNHPMELEVHHDGKVFIFDGNHRCQAADLSKLQSYPCKIRFYGGAQDNFDVNKILKQHPIKKEAYMSEAEKNIHQVEDLLKTAKEAIASGLPYEQIMEQMVKLSAGDAGGCQPGDVATYGDPTNQEYQSAYERGVCYEGENSQELGNTPTKRPRDLGEMTASLHKAISRSNSLHKKASHAEVIEIPSKDVGLEKGEDYFAEKNQSITQAMIVKYLKKHVYGKNDSFSIAHVEQEENSLFVKVLIYDRQINNITASAGESKGLEKKAWRKRETIMIGDSDEYGLVSCPIDGNDLVRSCGSCPLAENPHSYIADGYVICHFSDMNSWLSGNSFHEHTRIDIMPNI